MSAATVRLREIVASKTASDPSVRVQNIMAARAARIKTANERPSVQQRLREIVASKTASDPSVRVQNIMAARKARIKE